MRKEHLHTLARAAAMSCAAAQADHWASVDGYPDAGYLVVGAPRTESPSAGVDL